MIQQIKLVELGMRDRESRHRWNKTKGVSASKSSTRDEKSKGQYLHKQEEEEQETVGECLRMET